MIMIAVFETVRMFTGKAPDLPVNQAVRRDDF